MHSIRSTALGFFALVTLLVTTVLAASPQVAFLNRDWEFAIYVQNEDATVVDITGTSWSFKLYATPGATPTLTSTPTVTDGPNGLMAVTIAAASMTMAKGNYSAELVRTSLGSDVYGTWKVTIGAEGDVVGTSGPIVTRPVAVVLTPSAPTRNIVLRAINAPVLGGAGGAGITDGDKGDVTVSLSGAQWDIDLNSIALGADTVGNYAAGDAEAGAALTGDSATAFFSSGTIEDARVDGSAEVDEVLNSDLGDFTCTAGSCNVDANAIALGTDTTGNYAAGDAEAGNALTGDTATAFFSSGALEVARGGTGAAPSAADQVLVSDSTSAATWQNLPDSDGATQKLQYDVTTNAFSAGTDDDVPEVGDFAALVGGTGIDNNSGTLDLDLTEVTSAVLGNGTTSALQLGTIELGAATDTTIARVSAGTASVEGQNILTAATGQPLDADLTSWAAITRGSGFDTFATTSSSANLRSLLTDEIGTGVLVFLGTPADDAIPVGDSASATTWRALPDCDTALSSKLLYDQTTNSFSCGTDQTAGGGGTIGGIDTQVQFNDGGTFGGDAGFTYAKLTDDLTVAGDVNVGDDVILSSTGAVLSMGPTADCTLTQSSNALGTGGSCTWTFNSGTETISTAAISVVADSGSSDYQVFMLGRNTSAGVGGPGFVTFQDSASPAAGDEIGWWAMDGRDSTAAIENYGGFSVFLDDPVNGTEDTAVTIAAFSAGTRNDAVRIKPDYIMALSTGAFGWNNDTSLRTAPTLDTTLCRSAAGLVQTGTTACNSSGSLATTSIELGAASDTTVARNAAGDIQVEGNRIFRVGGADVPVADGGTGASSLTDLIALTTMTTGNYVQQVADGTGIDGSVNSEGGTYTPTLDLTEISSMTWGAGSFTSETWDAGAVDVSANFTGGTSVAWSNANSVPGSYWADNAAAQDSAGYQQIESGTGTAMAKFGIARFTNTATGVRFYFSKNRNTAVGSNTIVQSGDEVGSFMASAADGVDYAPVGMIKFAIDGTPGSNDMPGSITFATTADGANATTDRWIVDNTGTLKAGADNTYDIGTQAAAVKTAHIDTSIELSGTATTLTGTAGDISVEGNRIFRVGGADVPVADGGTGASSLTDLIALTTMTTGNYVGTITAGTGITGSSSSEGGTPTIGFDFGDAGASPSLGIDEARFTSNATVAGYLVFEGDTADTIETRIAVTDPTATDKTFTIPNADSNPVQPLTCTSTDKVSAISSAGVITCSADAGGGGGDNIRIEDADNAGTFTAAVDADFDDSGDINFARAAGPPDVITATVRADAVALTTDTTGVYVAQVADGTGIDGSCNAEGCTYTPTLDLTEISSATFGAGAFTTMVFDAAGATDPTFTYSNGAVNITNAAVTVTGNPLRSTAANGAFSATAASIIADTTTPAGYALTIMNVSNGGTGPGAIYWFDTASPAVEDIIGYLSANSRDSNGNNTDYVGENWTILDPTDTSEDSAWDVSTYTAGTRSQAFRLSSGATVRSDGFFGWNDDTSLATTFNPDTKLSRDAANALALGNSTSAQTFRVYNTRDAALGSPTNYERLNETWATNVATIATAAGGTGTLRDLKVTGGSNLDAAQPSVLLGGAGTTAMGATAGITLDIPASEGNFPRVAIQGNNADASGAFFMIHHNSASPANNDDLAYFEASGKDNGGNRTTFAGFIANSPDITDGSEDGTLLLFATVAGTRAYPWSIGANANQAFGNSGTVIGWNNDTDPTTSPSVDTGFARNAAGIVEVNSGTAGTIRDLRARNLISPYALSATYAVAGGL